MTRSQKLRALRKRLVALKDSAGRLNNEAWSRSHSAIIAPRYGKGTAIALADSACVKKGHGGFAVDPAGEQATARHMIVACPQAIASLVAKLEELFPELKEAEEQDEVT